MKALLLGLCWATTHLITVKKINTSIIGEMLEESGVNKEEELNLVEIKQWRDKKDCQLSQNQKEVLLLCNNDGIYILEPNKGFKDQIPKYIPCVNHNCTTL